MAANRMTTAPWRVFMTPHFTRAASEDQHALSAQRLELLMLRYYRPRASIKANRRPASSASAGPWKKFSAFVIARSNSFGKLVVGLIGPDLCDYRPQCPGARLGSLQAGQNGSCHPAQKISPD